MALWGCYLLSFQTGLRGGHLYIFGEIVPVALVSSLLEIFFSSYFCHLGGHFEEVRGVGGVLFRVRDEEGKLRVDGEHVQLGQLGIYRDRAWSLVQDVPCTAQQLTAWMKFSTASFLVMIRNLSPSACAWRPARNDVRSEILPLQQS